MRPQVGLPKLVKRGCEGLLIVTKANIEAHITIERRPTERGVIGGTHFFLPSIGAKMATCLTRREPRSNS
jgi:hypothetical protein